MNNRMNKMPNIPQAAFQRTANVIKWIVIILFGILPPVLLYSFADGIDYELKWAAGVTTIIVMSIVVSLVSYFSTSVFNDVIPMTVGFLMMGLGLYLIPLTGWWSLFFIIILPVLFLLGFILAFIGTSISFMIKMNREMKKMQEDPEVKRQMEEMQRMFNGQNPNQPRPPQANKQDKEENYKDNPYVDVEPEEDEEE